MSIAFGLQQLKAPSTAALPDGSLDRITATVASLGRRHPIAGALACAVVAYVAATSLMLAIDLHRAPTDAAAHHLGDALEWAMAKSAIASFLPALLSGLVVRLSSRAWPPRQIALLFLPMFLLVIALQSIGPGGN